MLKALLISAQSKCIYYSNFDPEFSPSPDLVGGFISAINTFAENISQDRISAIVMGKSKLHIYPLDTKREIVLVAVTDRKGKEKKMEGLIKDIKEAFLDSYDLEDVIVHASEPQYFDNFAIALNILLYKTSGQIFNI